MVDCLVRDRRESPVVHLKALLRSKLKNEADRIENLLHVIIPEIDHDIFANIVR